MFKDRLHQYLRGSGVLYYDGHFYATDCKKDPKSMIAMRHAKAKFGRDRLVDKICSDKSEREIGKLLKKYQRPQAMLDAIQPPQIIESGKEFFAFFDDHYGKDIHEMIRYLLIIKHRQLRKRVALGKDPTTVWRNNEVVLTDPGFQIQFYKTLFTEMRNPLAFRYAIAPQWWKEYNKKTLEDMYKSIRYHYNRCTDPDRTAIANMDMRYPKNTTRFAKAAAKFTTRMMREGVYIHPPKEIVSHGQISWELFDHPEIIRHLNSFNWDMYKQSLKRMILVNPWYFLNATAIQALGTDFEVTTGEETSRWSFKYLHKLYAFINDAPDIYERFDIPKIIGKEKSS